MDETTRRAIEHTILPIDPRGDTIVMTPGGDLTGYSHAEFVSEVKRIKTLLAAPPSGGWGESATSEPRFRNLIVDLSRSAYFGSEMIGSLVDLRKAVPENGVMALAGLSSDMEAGLRVMKLDQMWLTFDDKEEAVRAIATQTVAQKLSRHKKVLSVVAVALGVLLLLGILFYTPIGYGLIGHPTERRFREVADLYDRWRQTHDEGATQEELADAARVLRPKLTRFYEANRRKYVNMTDGEIELLEASVIFQDAMTLAPNDSFADRFERKMALAHDLLTDESGYDFESPLAEPPASGRRRLSIRDTEAFADEVIAADGVVGGLPPSAADTQEQAANRSAREREAREQATQAEAARPDPSAGAGEASDDQSPKTVTLPGGKVLVSEPAETPEQIAARKRAREKAAAEREAAARRRQRRAELESRIRQLQQELQDDLQDELDEINTGERPATKTSPTDGKPDGKPVSGASSGGKRPVVEEVATP